MSSTQAVDKGASIRRRVRNGALGLGMLALTFYFAFIAMLVYRSHR